MLQSPGKEEGDEEGGGGSEKKFSCFRFVDEQRPASAFGGGGRTLHG